MTNIHQARHDERKRKIHELFESDYRNQFDDFFEARDRLLEDIGEVFFHEYAVRFQTLALDDHNTTGRKEARVILQELCRKL